MNVTVHNVKKVRTRVKRLGSSGVQVVSFYIETDDEHEGFDHEITLFAGDEDIDLSDVIRL